MNQKEWYWLKLRNRGWTPAKLKNGCWIVGDWEYSEDSFAILEVGPNIPMPD